MRARSCSGTESFGGNGEADSRSRYDLDVHDADIVGQVLGPASGASQPSSGGVSDSPSRTA